MAKEPQTQLTKGVHAGSRADRLLEKGSKGIKDPSGKYGPVASIGEVDVSKALAGETYKQSKKRKEIKKRKQTPGHSR